MKKSVRIRKAGPGEKAGYYNKTAKFLNKTLPKANQGMQVQERMKVIMRDAYYAIRDGADPSAIYEQLVTQYGIEQQMAYGILDAVMKRLAKEGYKNPDYGKNEEDEDDIGTKQTPAPEQTNNSAQTVASTNDDEEAALAESDMPSGYDGMDHLNSGTSEYATEDAFGKYGGSFDDGGEYTDDYPEYYNNTEQTVLDQYANPGQLSTSEQIPFSLERLVEFTPGVQGLPKTPDLSYYLNNYAPIADDNAIPQDLLPENKYGGLNKFVSGGPGKGKGPGGPGKRGRKKSTKTETTTPTPPPPPITPESIRTEIIPQESIVQPNIFQRYQNFFGLNNPLSTRGFMGQRIENLGTVLNKARPRNWTQSGIGFGKFKTPGRESVAPFTTSTLLIEDINNIVRDPNYKPKTLIKNEDGTYGTGLGFNIDADLANFLIEKAQQAEKIIKDAGGKRVQKDGKTITLDIDDLMSIRDNELETTGTLLETPENQFTQKQLAQWQNYSDLREGFGLPGSTMPELDFLNLHRQNKGQIKISKDSKGLFKIELVSEVPTRLKGYKNTGLKIKDEIIVNPTTKEILDPTTKQPFSIADKNYYRGNRLRWYNRPYTLPFTPKYPDAFSSSDRGGNDLSTYPLDISDSPLKKEVPSYGNILWNTVGKGMLGLLPFTAGRFTNKSRFYPNAEQVKAGFYSRPRETGPQTAGGMTFGDQTLLDQYTDYNLMKNRNYQTGLGFLKTAGTLGLLGTYMYNQFTNEPDEDFFYDRQNNVLYNPNKSSFTGQGRVGYDPNFGVTTPRYDDVRNNYGKDSMFIQGADTTYDKVWGELGPNYKKGGAHKKQFVKNVMSKFAPGGESQDPSLGRGNRMDNLNQEVSNKKKWIPAIKKEADKKATDDLYTAVQKSGDPKLMNIFMGNNQQQQPQDNQMMQQPQFGEMGGYVNMDVENPLTRFIYGGDPCPEGSYWNGEECVPYAPGVPTREELFNDPTNLDYLNKLNRRRNVQDYDKWRENKLNEYIKQNYKGPRDSKGDVYTTPEWQEFLNSEEFQKLNKSLPNPEDEDGPLNFPKDYEQKNYYPKEGDWDEKSKKELNDLFNSEADEYEILRKFLEENPDYKEEYYDKGFNYMYNKLTPEQKSKYTPKTEELRKSRYDNWCPCSKTQEILVQGKPVQQKICVPCEQAKTGGYINRNSKNSLTKFGYGGDETDYYEPYSLPEAGGGITMPPGGSGGQYIADKMSPALDQNTFEPNPDNTDIVENPNCPPGYAYSRTYNQCVPIMQKRINYNMVRQTPGFINSIIPMNRLFNKYIVPDYRGMDNPYSRKNLRQYRKDNARDDRYRALPMLFAQRANREPREYNRYGINNFLTRSLPFGAFLQPKYRNGGINLTTTGNWMSGYNSNIDAPQGTSTEFDANGNPIKSVAPQPATPEQFYVNSNEKPAPQSPLAPNPFAAYKVKNQMQGENLDNTLNFFGNTYAGILNRNKMNPQNFANIMDTTNLLNNVPITTSTYEGQQQDIGQNMGTFGKQQSNDRNSLSTFGNYPSSQYGGYMEYGGFANPYEEEEVYMTDDEIQDYLARGGEIEYL